MLCAVVAYVLLRCAGVSLGVTSVPYYNLSVASLYSHTDQWPIQVSFQQLSPVFHGAMGCYQKSFYILAV